MTLKVLREVIELIKKYGHRKFITIATPIGELKERIELDRKVL